MFWIHQDTDDRIHHPASFSHQNNVCSLAENTDAMAEH